MKTLEEMYFTELDKQPELKPSMDDIVFISAFPNTNAKTKKKEIGRAIEDTMEEFQERWIARIKGDTLAGLKAGLQPQMVVQTVAPITRAELKEIIQGIDTYVPGGDTEELLALKVTELQYHFRSCMGKAGELMQEVYNEFMTEQQKQKIITPRPGIISPY